MAEGTVTGKYRVRHTLNIPSLAIIRGAQRPAPLMLRPALFFGALPVNLTLVFPV